jgi:hypothetical protein
MRPLARVAGPAVHLLLIAAALVAVATTPVIASGPERRALIVMVAVLAVVSLLGLIPWALGPVAEPVAARAVRMLGTGLAAAGVVGVAHGLGLGGSVDERAHHGIPIYTVTFALYLAAFLAATRRGTELAPLTLLGSAVVGLVAAALWAFAVTVLPPGIMLVGMLLIAGAGGLAAVLARPVAGRFLAGLLAVVTGTQALVFTAAVMLHVGPDAWMPYAGPGPLTPEAQLEQNRAEAVDPYTGLLLLGALFGGLLVVSVLAARRRVRIEPAAATQP